MNKNAAVSNAVAQELVKEGRPLGDPTQVMNAAPFLYTPTSMMLFLTAVQARLSPAFTFNFDGQFAGNALPMTVAGLINAIFAATQP
jgi:hypothetical protein